MVDPFAAQRYFAGDGHAVFGLCLLVLAVVDVLAYACENACQGVVLVPCYPCCDLVDWCVLQIVGIYVGEVLSYNLECYVCLAWSAAEHHGC